MTWQEREEGGTQHIRNSFSFFYQKHMFFRDAKIVISCLLEKKNLLDEVDSKLLSISYWERVFLKPRSKLSQKCNNNFLCLVLQGPHKERPVGSFRLRPFPTISAVVRILWHGRAPDRVSQLEKRKENRWQRESWKKLTMWNMATWKARKTSLPTNHWREDTVELSVTTVSNGVADPGGETACWLMLISGEHLETRLNLG